MANNTPANTQWHIDINPDSDKKLCGNCAYFDLWGVSTGYCPKKGKNKSSWGWCRSDFEMKKKSLKKINIKMGNVKCPYCGETVEISHEDGYGYEEDCLHNQECRKCGSVFAYTTTITYSYDAQKADCLNDGEHHFVPTKTFPKIFTKMECTSCGELRGLTKEEWHNVLSTDEIVKSKARFPRVDWIQEL